MRDAHPLAVGDGRLRHAHPLLGRAVVIGVASEAHLRARVEERIVERVLILGMAHQERTALSAPGISAGLIMFHPTKRR